MKKTDFINNFLSTQNITLDSNKTPVFIFDEYKNIILVNELYKQQFKDNQSTKKPDYFFVKENGAYKLFTECAIDDLLQKKDTIFFYRANNEQDHAFDFLTLFLGEYEGMRYYIALLFDVTHCKERLIDETMHALVKASQMKDNDTGQHIYRLNEYSRFMAEYIIRYHHDEFQEIDTDFAQRIGKVAAMHDIGKIGIPDYILTKPGKLTDEEFAIMKEHTINGAYILSEMGGKMARDIALFHHEKWNGTGYPYNLREDQIPLSARIVAIADVYDALRMKRSYKTSFTQEQSIEIMKNNRGEHFDPRLLDIFLKISDDFNRIFTALDDSEEI